MVGTAGDLQSLAKQKSQSWSHPARMEYVDEVKDVPNEAGEMGVDQNGQALMVTSPGKDMKAVWPPRGINLVITLPTPYANFAKLWMAGTSTPPVAEVVGASPEQQEMSNQLNQPNEAEPGQPVVVMARVVG